MLRLFNQVQKLATVRHVPAKKYVGKEPYTEFFPSLPLHSEKYEPRACAHILPPWHMQRFRFDDDCRIFGNTHKHSHQALAENCESTTPHISL